MSRFDSLPGRAMELVSQVGEGIKNNVPDRAIKWVETGAALGALKTGTKLATRLVRRNPAVVAAAAVGAGLLWYAARHRAKQAELEAIEGKSTRVEAKRSTAPRKRAASKRASRSQSESADSSN